MIITISIVVVALYVLLALSTKKTETQVVFEGTKPLIPAPQSRDLSYLFFGAQLEIHGRILIRGLSKKVHRLEIVDEVAYLDHHEIKLHPDDKKLLIKHINESHSDKHNTKESV